MNRKGTSYLIHSIAWVVAFILIEIMLPISFYKIPWQFHIKILATILVIVPIYYLNSRVLLPQYFFNKKKIQYFLLLLLIGSIAYFLSVLTSWLLDFEVVFHEYEENFFENRDHHHDPDGESNDIFFFLTVPALIYSTMVAITTNQRLQKEENEKLFHEKTAAELAQLRSQLNPHFLFNTLNNIYALIETDKVLAQEKTHELSGLLRYVLYEANAEYVSVKSELDFIRKYINLMRIRLKEETQVNVQIIKDEDEKIFIRPLLFIPLIENAFKHGVNPNGVSIIDIIITQQEGELELKTLNSIYKSSEIDETEGGIGLANVKKRIILFPDSDRYTFEAKEITETFVAKLVIPVYDQMPGNR